MWTKRYGVLHILCKLTYQGKFNWASKELNEHEQMLYKT